MGDYRTIAISTWRDTRFEELSAHAKYLFFYLMTNEATDIGGRSGAYEISLKHIAYQTGLERGEIPALLEELAPMVRWWPVHNVVFVVNHFEYQNHSPHYLTSARNDLRGKPAEVIEAVVERYPILNPSASLPKGIEKASASEGEAIPKPSPRQGQGLPMPKLRLADVKEKAYRSTCTVHPIPDQEQTTTTTDQDAGANETQARRDFNQFVQSYPAPKRDDEHALWAAWQAQVRGAGLPPLPELMASLAAYKESPDWIKDGGRYIQKATRWIGNRMWETPPVINPNAYRRGTLVE